MIAQHVVPMLGMVSVGAEIAQPVAFAYPSGSFWVLGF